VSRSKKRKTRKAAGSRANSAAGEQVWRRHPAGERQQALERMALGGNLSALARELGVHRNLLYYWRNHQNNGPGQASMGWDPETAKVRELECRIASLEGSLGRKTLELDFFVSALRRIAGRRPRSKATGERASTEKSGTERRPGQAD
jgi:transposase-like protein